MAENIEFVNVDESYKFSAISSCEEYDHVKKCVLKLEAEVESLKKVDGKVKGHELSCQIAKKWYIVNSKKTQDLVAEEQTSSELPEEFKSNLQFLEILDLLSMIQKEERQLNMVKYQLYLAKKEQELSVFKSLVSNTSTNIHRINDSPLNVWFSEIKQWMSTNECWKMSEGKFCDTSRLFYDVKYMNGTPKTHDSLVEKILKMKSRRRNQYMMECSNEELCFSTFHKGFRIRISITARTQENCDKEKSYEVHSSLHLNFLLERLLEYLKSKKNLQDFVALHMWKEIENLTSSIKSYRHDVPV
ncbi:uncharacterized protein LOC124442012 [Xenia sp. Carnegie-2017]|uniref:uncharacterized protein LOC124442012 n=1 Tax=Xenia sp. Carnegie-2017 TaxID=2897299 RepID=UPI001F03E998|nr:uncharacterized protein LOC124442012 [Xenia sp. Carnegie-2017]